MALSVEDLKNLEKMPDENEITLKTIALFYEKYLCNCQFFYAISHKRREIRLRFKKGDLCHLLGIQHIIKGQKYRGEQGYEGIVDERITLQKLKKANIGQYKSIQYRILYFPFIHQLIHNPNIVFANKQQSKSIAEAQFIFYNKYDPRYIELRLRTENENNPNFFVPISFSVQRKVMGRRHINIRNFEILDYNEGYQ